MSTHSELREEIAGAIESVLADLSRIRGRTYAVVGRLSMPRFDREIDEASRRLTAVREVLIQGLPAEALDNMRQGVMRAQEPIECEPPSGDIRPWTEVCAELVKDGELIEAVKVCRRSNPLWSLTQCKDFVQSL